MTALTNSQIKTLSTGDRVTFPDGAEAYPDFHFGGERLDGTVTENDGECVWVKLDTYKAELDEWDNQIQIWLWNMTDADLSEEEREKAAHDVERLLDANGTSLDLFIQDYCPKHNIEIEGGAFGMVFSGEQTEFTEAEAIALIEDAARIYGLRI